jgi:hypothetical protein
MKLEFDRAGYFCLDIPTACLADLTRSGDVSLSASYWVSELEFESSVAAKREEAESFLYETGGWSREDMELAKETDSAVACRVLWVAAGTAAEFEGEHREGAEN